MTRRSRGIHPAWLWGLLLLPLIITGASWYDAHYSHVFLLTVGSPNSPTSPADIAQEDLLRLKKSILNVRVPDCSGDGLASGTSFVIAPGYAATAAHVVDAAKDCGSEITLIDHRGLPHRGQLSAYSDADQLDLAVVKFDELGLEPLSLAESKSYEAASTAIDVVTIGYPPAASTEDEAALSAPGVISSFREGRFFTSGMALNPGNSGGPVFVKDTWTVLGVAVMKGNAATGGEGLGIVVPSDTLEEFFEERTGQRL